MTTTIVSAPSPPQLLFSLHRNTCNSPLSNVLTPVFVKAKQQQQRFTLQCSHFSSTSVVEEEGSPPFTAPPSENASLDSDGETEDLDALSLRGCEACGREEIERGCNGEGRIQGGIATIPGFGWWPIKAYRPCPGFVASGGRYKRRGQSMDEVAFGGGKGKTSTEAFDETPSRKKGMDRRKFKA
ncbi:hypothetical protein Ancab_032837 [Ancistrocladus abbreviatus]